MHKVFKNHEGNDIAASIFGKEPDPLVVFLHGEDKLDSRGMMQQKISLKKDFL